MRVALFFPGKEIVMARLEAAAKWDTFQPLKP